MYIGVLKTAVPMRLPDQFPLGLPQSTGLDVGLDNQKIIREHLAHSSGQ